MKLGDVDPYALMIWAQQAYMDSGVSERVELHVFAQGYELRAPRESPEPLRIEPDPASEARGR